MKKFLALLLASVLICLCVPVSFASGTEIAYSTKSSVYIDGSLLEVESYIINDQSYFKLRDIAYALVCVLSDKGFSVKWDEEKEEISLFSKSPYSKVGGELEIGDGTDKTAVKAVSGVYVDGKWVSMSSYNINGNNYFWLRDIGKALDFNVYWLEDMASIFVDSSSSYTGTYTGADDKFYTVDGVDARKLSFYTASPDVPEFGSVVGLDEKCEVGQTYEEEMYIYGYDLSAYTEEEIWDKIGQYAIFLKSHYDFVIMPNSLIGLDSNSVAMLSTGGRLMSVSAFEDKRVGIVVHETIFPEEEVKKVLSEIRVYNAH